MTISEDVRSRFREIAEAAIDEYVAHDVTDAVYAVRKRCCSALQRLASRCSISPNHLHASLAIAIVFTVA